MSDESVESLDGGGVSPEPAGGGTVGGAPEYTGGGTVGETSETGPADEVKNDKKELIIKKDYFTVG